MSKDSFDEIIKQFSNTLPPQLQTLKREFEKELRRGLTLVVQNLDLVSRQEFDIQTQVLARTREKLERLEKRVLELENLNVQDPLDDESI